MMKLLKESRGCPKSAVVLLFLIFLISFSLISCTTEVTLTVQKDDSVAINFEGGAGDAFTKMLSSAAGVSASGQADAAVIDEAAVSYELARAGFDSVRIQQKKGGSVQISMNDKKQSSYIFTSGIIKSNNGRLSAAISKKSLEDFYASADEQTRMILDLFLAPVFNDENMTEAEYLEMLASFYGKSAADEVSQSLVKINLISKDGSRESLRYPLTQLLCGLF